MLEDRVGCVGAAVEVAPASAGAPIIREEISYWWKRSRIRACKLKLWLKMDLMRQTQDVGIDIMKTTSDTLRSEGRTVGDKPNDVSK